MKRLWMSGAAAVMALSIASVGAQQQPPQSQTPQTQPPQAAQPAADSTTVQGCVYKEADVPGRAPNVAEKAGIGEDYILVASPAKSETAGTSGTTPPPAGAPGMSAAPTKAYKLEKIADEQLKAVVGKRVEVTGRVDASGSSAAAPGKLVDFEVASIKEVEGSCPATPNLRK